jgi:hypothetical protein
MHPSVMSASTETALVGTLIVQVAAGCRRSGAKTMSKTQRLFLLFSFLGVIVASIVIGQFFTGLDAFYTRHEPDLALVT